MDHHENKEKPQPVTQKGGLKQISQEDYYSAPKRTVDEPKTNEKKGERESNYQKYVHESRTGGDDREHAWVGKSSETKQVQNIPNDHEKEYKENRGRLEDTVSTYKGIGKSYEEKSRAQQETSLQPKHGIEKMYPNGSKPVEYVSKKTENTEWKKKEETESNRKHIYEKEVSEEKKYPNGSKSVETIPKKSENTEWEKKNEKKDEKTREIPPHSKTEKGSAVPMGQQPSGNQVINTVQANTKTGNDSAFPMGQQCDPNNQQNVNKSIDSIPYTKIGKDSAVPMGQLQHGQNDQTNGTKVMNYIPAAVTPNNGSKINTDELPVQNGSQQRGPNGAPKNKPPKSDDTKNKKGKSGGTKKLCCSIM